MAKAKAKKKKGAATPQPPAAAPPPPAPAPAVPGYQMQYTPTIESQINQPYQDVLGTYALSMLPNIQQNWQGMQDYANFYGGAGAQMFGNFMAGAEPERQLTSNFGGQAGGTLGQYGQLIGANSPIMQGWQDELQAIQAGKADFDPMLTQQFNDQERVLRDQLRRQLGPDYETSSAGIEALGKFNQNKTTTLSSAQFQRGLQLQDALQSGYQNLANQSNQFANTYGGQRGQQFNQADIIGQRYGQYANDLYNQAMGLRQTQLQGGAQMLQNTATMQGLYAGIPQTMGQFGQAMQAGTGANVSAQGPYQQDRALKAQLSYAPTEGQYMGQMMAQSGDRWAQIGSSIGGMGAAASKAGSSAGAG